MWPSDILDFRLADKNAYAPSRNRAIEHRQGEPKTWLRKGKYTAGSNREPTL
jgi:hypothetical protein